MLFCGKGAGPLPSASAVLSDIVDIACHQGGFRPTDGATVGAAPRDYESKHYLRFAVDDPSAIGTITTVLERNGVGVARAAAVWAKTVASQNQVRVLTHAGSRKAVDGALAEVAAKGIEPGRALVLRVGE